MPKPSLDEVLNVGDPMLNDNFDLVINTGLVALDTSVELILAAYRLKVRETDF